MTTASRFACAAALGLAAHAFAGPQYVDPSGFAVSGYDVVAYFDKEQAPLGQPQPAPTPGRASITAERNGATFAFATEANRAKFVADPAAYAPRYDGHCAYGVAGGYKVPGDPQRWRIVDGVLHLNYSAEVAREWDAAIPELLAKSDANWPAIDSTPASDEAVLELPLGTAPLRN